MYCRGSQARSLPINLFFSTHSMKKTTILIADDHTLVRETWSFMLNAYPQYCVVGECGSGEEAIELTRRLHPDVVLIDINLPGMNGLEATAHIRRSWPAAKIVGVSMHNHPTYAREMIRQGASAYVTKSSPSEELFRAIGEVLRGKKYICQEIKDTLSEQIISSDNGTESLRSLTARELQVIARIARGATSREISEELGVALKTIEVHRYNILQKLKLKNTASLINFVNQHRLELIA